MLVTERFHISQGMKNDIVTSLPHNFGFNGFGEATYYRTYSRLQADNTYETWIDTCTRTVEGLMSIRKNWYKLAGLKWEERKWEKLGIELLSYIYQMKLLPPGRGLWALGTEHVHSVGSMALCNCANTKVTPQTFQDDLPWAMDALMCGCGVGFELMPSEAQLNFILATPSKEEPKIIYQIPDTREGWVDSVRLLLNSYRVDSQNRREIHFDYSLIRKFGELIKGFGGTASGPGPLIILHARIRAYMRLYLDNRISALRLFADLANAIGVCIVSGNVRRGAEILIYGPQSKEFLELKQQKLQPDQEHDWEMLTAVLNTTFDLSKHDQKTGYTETVSMVDELTPDHFLLDRLVTLSGYSLIGGLSNNTCKLQDKSDFGYLPHIAEMMRTNGEPGILNMRNVVEYARYGDKKFDPATGANPCVEVPLEDKELCNLVEIFPTQCQTTVEFNRACYLAAFYSQTISLLPTHSHETNAVIARNRRIGVSLTGMADYLDVIGAVRLTTTLRKAYDVVEQTADYFAREAGVPNSIRRTTIKPSGTVSQLPGVSSGMHRPPFPWAIRRMRVGRDTVTDHVLRKASIPYELDVTSNSTNIFSFPIDQGATRPATAVTAWEQFAFLAMLQREWADNMVSCTVYFDPETEGHQLEQMLGQFVPLIKSVSLLPHSTAGAYPQMPYEGITEEEYNLRSSKIKPIEWQKEFNASELEQDQTGILYCDNDSCEVV